MLALYHSRFAKRLGHNPASVVVFVVTANLRRAGAGS